jgi:beta-glucanase (GH16 family)
VALGGHVEPLFLRVSASRKHALLLASTIASTIFLSAGAAWAPVWVDHFTAPSLDPALWTVRDNMTHGDREWQLYLQDEVYVENGHLVIRTRSRNASHGARLYNFTSGWVDTRGSALGENTYGKFSARIQLPVEAVGVWPAYWLVDDNNHCWPTGGEIDILEAVGGVKGDSVSGTLHWGQACGKDDWEGDGQRSGHFPHPPGAPFSADFHNFTAYWNKTAVTWEVDGQPFVSRLAGQPADLFVPSWPLFTIFNTAMSFFGVPQPPPPLAEPVFMRVDWAGAWRWDGPGGATGDFEIPYNGTGLVPP